MTIGLIDVDSHNFPSLPLMKISAYHKSKGDEVEWHIPFNAYNKVYISKIFTQSKEPNYFIQADEIIKGGTGYDLQNSLPQEIEHIYPDYSLYPQYKEAYGFLTRGCPRQCPFCIVSKKEGVQSQQVADLKEFWNGQPEIKLLDANILACSDAPKLLNDLISSKAYIDFTQGIDARLLNPDIIALLKQIKIRRVHFAWDNPKDKKTPANLEYFAKQVAYGRGKRSVYILTNFNSTYEEDLERVYEVRELGYQPYVMIYNKEKAPLKTRHLQRWANNPRVFWKVPRFDDFNHKIA